MYARASAGPSAQLSRVLMFTCCVLPKQQAQQTIVTWFRSCTNRRTHVVGQADRRECHWHQGRGCRVKGTMGFRNLRALGCSYALRPESHSSQRLAHVTVVDCCASDWTNGLCPNNQEHSNANLEEEAIKIFFSARTLNSDKLYQHWLWWQWWQRSEQ